MRRIPSTSLSLHTRCSRSLKVTPHFYQNPHKETLNQDVATSRYQDSHNENVFHFTNPIESVHIFCKLPLGSNANITGSTLHDDYIIFMFVGNYVLA